MPGGGGGLTGRWAARFRGLRARAEERLPVLTEIASRLLGGTLLDAGTRLAAQAFLAAVPLLFAVAAFAPASVRDQLRDSLRAMFGLSGRSDVELQQVLGGSGDEELRDTTGAIGLVIALASATSFSRAMARVCERAWALPKAKTRVAAWRWVVWLLALLVVVLVQGPLRDGFGAGLWLGVPLFFLVSVGIWMWTQHLLLAKRVPWLPLLPGAILAAAATSALALTARLYMPAALNKALAEYGSLGLVLTMLSWLIVVCASITFAFTIGAVLAQEPPLSHHLGPRTYATDGADEADGSVDGPTDATTDGTAASGSEPDR
ncbi:YhjD/YihY/BrkB family envelope integrity protein [Streptomyces sp. NPDC055893]|uniref:YhjD/YihY/BrkB family envelope integrity protein n=1 Tax=Streptomyces sp. MBT42 TaxID=1488373 RepID=UPI001E43B23F|nr:YhjD/YihY/BrkB family envelope integrity protein [Streptomyces sp. MBT42]MCD2463483.1 YihY/virulence factor BrkB family protein [Streptomyces sp. MBT42]